jgi:hypothetical protein
MKVWLIKLNAVCQTAKSCALREVFASYEKAEEFRLELAEPDGYEVKSAYIFWEEFTSAESVE